MVPAPSHSFITILERSLSYLRKRTALMFTQPLFGKRCAKEFLISPVVSAESRNVYRSYK